MRMTKQHDTQLTVWYSRDADGHEYATCAELPAISLHGRSHDQLNRDVVRAAQTMIALMLRFTDLEVLRKNIRTETETPELPGAETCGSEKLEMDRAYATLLALMIARAQRGWTKHQAAKHLGISSQNLGRLEAQVLGGSHPDAASF